MLRPPKAEEAQELQDQPAAEDVEEQYAEHSQGQVHCRLRKVQAALLCLSS